ncbi:D-Ala-D-Ala carboxypeptidase family metallohydrolase [Sphingobacterium sp. 1.A.5]|uniref:YcbK family protein n=1 Tax=Sphingobacterium sp. 1.A.5 TaxID=2044604 RepID=UPI000C0C0BA2|nr:D-Ala-D-Ala carboxypeptidase family metallohydrolase [Sphingobacterium sp. 1.A.5]
MTLKELKDLCLKNNIKVDGDHIEFNASTPNFQLTKNFRLQEFLTKNKKDTTTKINLKIILELQNLRTLFGSPIGISSSYRSPSYNRSVNGATNSQHLYGNALDTYPINGDIKGWLSTVVKNKKEGGCGQYKTFVHIDCGATRFWRG